MRDSNFDIVIHVHDEVVFEAKKYEKMKMSLILTIVSLGTRVLLAYLLAPSFGVEMIWWAIVIGWILADTIGIVYGIKIEKWFK